jgi:uroporphyrinogen III methyltransferase/synthase
MQELQGKRVLITRDVSQAEGLKEKLGLLSAEVLCVATIAISGPPDWKPFDYAAEAVSNFDWVVFSSTNAVRQTSMRLSQLAADHDQFNTLKKAAVGKQTAAAANEEGWRIDLVPGQFQAEGLLAALLKSDLKGKKIWIPRALQARSFLIDELEKAGAEVVETPVYQNTIPYENRDRLRHILLNEKIDWITFTSSSTVTNFFKILGDRHLQIQLSNFASIGKITTETIIKHGYIPSFTAKPQNLEGLCQGIVEWETAASESD